MAIHMGHVNFQLTDALHKLYSDHAGPGNFSQWIRMSLAKCYEEQKGKPPMLYEAPPPAKVEEGESTPDMPEAEAEYHRLVIANAPECNGCYGSGRYSDNLECPKCHSTGKNLPPGFTTKSGG